jgi:hypothetical protein
MTPRFLSLDLGFGSLRVIVPDSGCTLYGIICSLPVSRVVLPVEYRRGAAFDDAPVGIFVEILSVIGMGQKQGKVVAVCLCPSFEVRPVRLYVSGNPVHDVHDALTQPLLGDPRLSETVKLKLP